MTKRIKLRKETGEDIHGCCSDSDEIILCSFPCFSVIGTLPLVSQEATRVSICLST